MTSYVLMGIGGLLVAGLITALVRWIIRATEARVRLKDEQDAALAKERMDAELSRPRTRKSVARDMRNGKF